MKFIQSIVLLLFLINVVICQIEESAFKPAPGIPHNNPTSTNYKSPIYVDKIGLDDCDPIKQINKYGLPCGGWNSEDHPNNPGARAKAGPSSNVLLVENLRPFGRFMEKRRKQQHDIIKKKKYCPNSFHSQTMDTKIELMRGIYNRADAWQQLLYKNYQF